MTKSKATEQISEVLYQSEKNPKIDYADSFRANSSEEGSLFQFGQSHPDRNGMTIISEIFLPKRVCILLRDALNQLIDEMEKIK